MDCSRLFAALCPPPGWICHRRTVFQLFQPFFKPLRLADFVSHATSVSTWKQIVNKTPLEKNHRKRNGLGVEPGLTNRKKSQEETGEDEVWANRRPVTVPCNGVDGAVEFRQYHDIS
jgi:hypothetical protein